MNHFEKHVIYREFCWDFSLILAVSLVSQIILFVSYQELDMQRGCMLQLENTKNLIYLPIFFPPHCSTESIPWGLF